MAAFIREENLRPDDGVQFEAAGSPVKSATQPSMEALLEGVPSGGAVDFENFGGDGDDDDLYTDAVETVIAAKKASASLLQRRLKVGYARAARLLDLMEERGVIGPGDGAKPREVYAAGASIEGVSDEG